MPKVSEAQLERRRQQILDAALACFARKGFHRTTMADIAAEAGVSDGLAYRYFSGKDEIIRMALRESDAAIDADRSIEQVVDGDDAVLLLDLLLDAHLRRFDEGSEIRTLMTARLQSWAEAAHDSEAREHVRERWAHHLEVGEELMVRVQEKRGISSGVDARAAARVLLAMLDGLTLQALLDSDVDLEDCKDVMLAMFSGRFVAGSEVTD